MFTILLYVCSLPALTLSDAEQQFVGTVLRVEKDTMIDFVNFENSTENWNIKNMLKVNTGGETNNFYEIPKHYRYIYETNISHIIYVSKIVIDDEISEMGQMMMMMMMLRRMLV